MTVGRLHSIETLGGLDGPGVRCVVFLQGCSLRCRYCHNPDTWDAAGGTAMESAVVVQAIQRVRPYFGRTGGVTLSGGEPLLQAAFCREVLGACRSAGIHTTVDTAGVKLSETVAAALEQADLVLLDVKHADPQRHRELTGGELATTLEFLKHLAAVGKPTWIRQVIVPGWNDTPEDVQALVRLLDEAGGEPADATGQGPLPSFIQKIELLPYRKLGCWKYRQLGLADPLEGTPELDEAAIDRLRKVIEPLTRDRH